MLTDTDRKFLRLAYEEAKAGYDEGGCPIGSVLARGDELVSQGRNQRVQKGDPIAHGEMDALRKAGRQTSYRDMTIYTSLSPCMMCTGTIIQFGIPRVVIGENTTFGGNEEFLRSKGVEVIIALKNLMRERGIVPKGVDRLVEGLRKTGRSAMVTSATHRRREELGLPPLPELDLEPLEILLAEFDTPADDKGKGN